MSDIHKELEEGLNLMLDFNKVDFFEVVMAIVQDIAVLKQLAPRFGVNIVERTARREAEFGAVETLLE